MNWVRDGARLRGCIHTIVLSNKTRALLSAMVLAVVVLLLVVELLEVLLEPVAYNMPITTQNGQLAE